MDSQESAVNESVKQIGGIEIDEIDATALEDGSSQCDSESAVSITNLNYCGPSATLLKVSSGKRKTSKTGESKGKRQSHGSKELVVIFCNTSYLFSCNGALRLLHMILSLVALVSVSVCSTKSNEDFLSLPLDWHLRIMVFVAVLAFLVSMSIWIINITGIITALPVNWFLIDMLVYSVLSFLFLISASLVASTFDFYQKMNLGIPSITIQRLIICTIAGYVCMLVHGLTAFIGYRRWHFQQALFKRRKLLEEQDDYLDI